MDRLVQQPASVRTAREHSPERVRAAVRWNETESGCGGRTQLIESPENPGRFTLTAHQSFRGVRRYRRGPEARVGSTLGSIWSFDVAATTAARGGIRSKSESELNSGTPRARSRVEEQSNVTEVPAELVDSLCALRTYGCLAHIHATASFICANVS